MSSEDVPHNLLLCGMTETPGHDLKMLIGWNVRVLRCGHYLANHDAVEPPRRVFAYGRSREEAIANCEAKLAAEIMLHRIEAGVE